MLQSLNEPHKPKEEGEGGQDKSDGNDADEGGNEEDGHDGEEGSLVLVPGDLRPAEDGGAQHLSLSRTLYLRSHHIDPFVADLRRALAWAAR